MRVIKEHIELFLILITVLIIAIGGVIIAMMIENTKTKLIEQNINYEIAQNIINDKETEVKE